jgi:hypothetical protein
MSESASAELWKILGKNEKEELVETLTIQGRHLKLTSLVELSKCESMKHLDGKIKLKNLLSKSAGYAYRVN